MGKRRWAERGINLVYRAFGGKGPGIAFQNVIEGQSLTNFGEAVLRAKKIEIHFQAEDYLRHREVFRVAHTEPNLWKRQEGYKGTLSFPWDRKQVVEAALAIRKHHAEIIDEIEACVKALRDSQFGSASPEVQRVADHAEKFLLNGLKEAQNALDEAIAKLSAGSNELLPNEREILLNVYKKIDPVMGGAQGVVRMMEVRYPNIFCSTAILAFPSIQEQRDQRKDLTGQVETGLAQAGQIAVAGLAVADELVTQGLNYAGGLGDKLNELENQYVIDPTFERVEANLKPFAEPIKKHYQTYLAQKQKEIELSQCQPLLSEEPERSEMAEDTNKKEVWAKAAGEGINYTPNLSQSPDLNVSEPGGDYETYEATMMSLDETTSASRLPHL